jgi:hypothetical protein
MTIITLPDDILLEIFDFYVYEADHDGWHTLVHVCRQWRNVVFGSPRRLDLELHCKASRSVREMLDIWPDLPIIVADGGRPTVEGADNIISALELNDRVCRIHLGNVSSPVLVERFVAVMQDPFPALAYLSLGLSGEVAPVISDSFLGGTVPPGLRYFGLRCISFPALPNLLLSATGLCYLNVRDIPHSGYISPEAMVTCLAALTRLESLILGFRSPRSRPSRESRRRPPLTRTILPALIHLGYKGVTEYLEDLVTRIDVPLLQNIEITFFNQLVFDIFRLPKFLVDTEKFTGLDRAEVLLGANTISVTLPLQTGTVDTARLKLQISCRTLDWQLSSLAQVCTSCLTTLSTLEHLDIREARRPPQDWQDDMEDTQWLELLQPFTTIKNLYLSKEVARRVAPALKELAREQVTEVLPALQNLFLNGLQLSGPVEEVVGQFVAARELSGHPLAIHR